MPAFKPQYTSDVEEFDTRTAGQRNGLGMARMVESARLGLTVLALLMGTTIVATSADALGVYNNTHLSQEFFLPLWPNEFDVRPSVALIACGTIILLTSAISLALSKVPSVCPVPLLPFQFPYLLVTLRFRISPWSTPRSLSWHPLFASWLPSLACRSSTESTHRRPSLPFTAGAVSGLL